MISPYGYTLCESRQSLFEALSYTVQSRSRGDYRARSTRRLGKVRSLLYFGRNRNRTG